MRRIRGLLAVGGVVALVGSLGGCAASQPWQSSLVTANDAGTDGGNGDSSNFPEWSHAFVPLSTKIVFVSLASDLDPRDTDGDLDVYLHDYATHETTLVSVDAAGTGNGNGDSYAPVASPDGTKVAFYSWATNLTSTPPANAGNVYVYDIATATTSAVSVDENGIATGGAVSASFSPDGDRIAYNQGGAIWVRDLVTGARTLVSISADGTGNGNAESSDPVFSPNGHQVAFLSLADNLGPIDREPWDSLQQDLYIRDLATQTTSLVGVNSAGTGSADRPQSSPFFNADGTKVGFTSAATNLVTNDTNNNSDVFVRDLQAGTTTLVTVNTASTQASNGASQGIEFSPSGTKIVFQSGATDLVPGDSNGRNDVFVRDLAAGTTTLVSANGQATGGGNADSSGGRFNADGTKVVFMSSASNLGPYDANSGATCYYWNTTLERPCADVYERNLTANTTTLVSANQDRNDSANGDSSLPVYGPDGLVLFSSDGDNFGPADTNGQWDIYLARPTDSG